MFLGKLFLWETHLAGTNLTHFYMLKLIPRDGSDYLSYILKVLDLKMEFLRICFLISNIIIVKNIVYFAFLN